MISFLVYQKIQESHVNTIKKHLLKIIGLKTERPKPKHTNNKIYQ